MKPRLWTPIPFLLLAAFDAGAQVKDLSPPPLNPHPKEALHVTVSFDRPEDAKRYAIVMQALYQNQQSECGYIEDNWNRRFIYPKRTFDIPNKSSDRRRAKFDIYLDRYDEDSCNWELASPQVIVRDTQTSMEVLAFWGLRENLFPGTAYRATCPFRRSDHALRCFDEEERVPDTPFFQSVPDRRRIPITIHVDKDSAPLRPQPPSHFSNFVEPIPSHEATIPAPSKDDN